MSVNVLSFALNSSGEGHIDCRPSYLWISSNVVSNCWIPRLITFSFCSMWDVSVCFGSYRSNLVSVSTDESTAGQGPLDTVHWKGTLATSGMSGSLVSVVGAVGNVCTLDCMVVLAVRNYEGCNYYEFGKARVGYPWLGN